MITHDHNVIFIHIPKCGGRSICDMFNQRFDHFTARYYEKEYEKFWKEYRKFTIVRNPYSRLVSIFHYVIQHRRHSFESISAPSPSYETVGHPSFGEWVYDNFSAFKNPFNLNSPEAERGKDWMIGSPFWFSPQERFLRSETGEIDVFRIEDGIEKIESYLASIGVEKKIPHVNKSSHQPWQSYYDEKILSIVNEYDFIKSDCTAFGYDLL